MILEKIVEAKKKRLAREKEIVSFKKMKEAALNYNRKTISFYEALSKDGLSVIAEFKMASPSHGKMDNKISLEDRIKDYAANADAISCLTEIDYFKGSSEYLKEIRKMTKLPIIRKDFIIDPYQVYEAKLIGADAILLIAAILNDEEFKSLYDLAKKLGLDVLSEVHNKEEMKRVLDLGVDIIGINNRNLKDFTISLDTSKETIESFRDELSKRDVILVSESGILNTKDISKLSESNIDAVLIGTVLMESTEPEKLIRDFKETFKRKK